MYFCFFVVVPLLLTHTHTNASQQPYDKLFLAHSVVREKAHWSFSDWNKHKNTLSVSIGVFECVDKLKKLKAI